MECGLQKKTFTILLDTRTPSYYHLDFSHHDSLFIPTKTVTMSTNKGTAPDRLLAFYLPHCLPLHTSAPKNPGSNYFIAWDISSLLPSTFLVCIVLHGRLLASLDVHGRLYTALVVHGGLLAALSIRGVGALSVCGGLLSALNVRGGLITALVIHGGLLEEY